MQALLFILIALLGTVSLVAFFQVIRVLFTRVLEIYETPIEEYSTRTFYLGLANFLFSLILAALFFMLAEQLGTMLLFIPGLLLVIFFLVTAIFSLTFFGIRIGKRLFPEAGDFKSLNYGALVMILAILLPYVGWFFLLPYMLIIGYGAVISHLLQKRRKRKAETVEE